MLLRILKDYETLSQEVCKEIISLIQHQPAATLCLAAGDTPRLAYALVADSARSGGISFSQCTFIGLDEWVGIPPDNPGSCRYFLETNLFAPLGISSSQIHMFDALTHDLSGECLRIDAIISEKGGIDLMVVGVGMNGHIGFNEPGVPVDLRAHVVELDATTRSVGQKYFQNKTELDRGITLGLRHFLDSRRAVLIASGAKKAPIIRQVLEGPVSTIVPASIIRRHSNGIAMLDEECAAQLSNRHT